MTGKLSDRPMILAASIPHLGQTTPTAALGLRAMRSLLTRLDASWPSTVLPTLFELTCIVALSPGMSGNQSFPARNSRVFFVRTHHHARRRPERAAVLRPHSCIRHRQTRHFRDLPILCRTSESGRGSRGGARHSYMVVCVQINLDAIVGILLTLTAGLRLGRSRWRHAASASSRESH